jgi:hypothetical protein
MLQKKLHLTLMGYLFCFTNIYFTLNGYNLLGISFGIVAIILFIKALRIKREE